MDKRNITNNELDIDDFVKLVEKECEKRGWVYDERFGFVYIHTKFESWNFELTNRKIKLMHKNTRHSSSGDYHIQWKKFVTVRYLTNYIGSHEKSKYLVKKNGNYKLLTT